MFVAQHKAAWVVGATLIAFVLLLGPRLASAHIQLISPSPRQYLPSEQKTGPCGRAGGIRTANATTFEPGATIEVVWDETVPHQAHYRIAFDDNGHDVFRDPVCTTNCTTNDPLMPPTFAPGNNLPVLLDGISDRTGMGRYRVTLTLPNIECDNCTLQLIQVMYDKRPYVTPGNDVYYQCADLLLRAGGGGDAGVSQPQDGGVAEDASDGTALDGGVGGGSRPRDDEAGSDSEPSTGCYCVMPTEKSPFRNLIFGCIFATLVAGLTCRRDRRNGKCTSHAP